MTSGPPENNEALICSRAAARIADAGLPALFFPWKVKARADLRQPRVGCRCIRLNCDFVRWPAFHRLVVAELIPRRKTSEDVMHASLS